MESKKDIYDLVPPQHIPQTVLIKKEKGPDEVRRAVSKAQLLFPLIAKPDIGMKGLGVERIQNHNALNEYQSKMQADFLIQELIDYPMEIGLFYVRFPGQSRGRITGIVAKEFLSVTGNGRDTLEALVIANPRSGFERSKISLEFGERWNEVLPEGERLILVPIGSHTRGAKFTDLSHAVTDTLVDTFDRICGAIQGFHYGRLDILCASLEDLARGENFRIIEVNGAGSEPTHIYDPSHSLFFAWKEILAHWHLMCTISRINRKQGFGYLTYREGMRMLRTNNALEAQLRLL